MRKIMQVVFLMIIVSIYSCGGDIENKNSHDPEDSVPEEKRTSEDRLPNDGFSWNNIPIYPGAVLEAETDCAAKWADCEICEHRIYVTDDDPNAVCTFYREEMPKKGWKKIVFQIYPEGSCLGTWLSSDSEIRVLLNAAKRRSDRRTFVAITMGKGCPD